MDTDLHVVKEPQSETAYANTEGQTPSLIIAEATYSRRELGRPQPLNQDCA